MSAPSRRAAAAGNRDAAAPSGRLLLRMPRTLHGALAEAAEREGTSLNGFITGTLASAIGWSGEEGLKEAPRRAATPPESPQSRRLVLLLVANVLAVGLAGLTAIAILLLAWLG